MYNRYKAPFGAVAWSYMVWYAKRFHKAFPDFLAGFAFGCLVSLLPIVTAFIIR